MPTLPRVTPPAPSLSAPVDVPSVSDSRDEHEALRIDDGVDDPVVTDPDPIVVPTGQLDRTMRTRLGRESVDRATDAITHWTL